MRSEASRIERGSSPIPWIWRPSELTDYDGPLLLDTHIWVWHIDGDERQTTAGTRELLDRSGSASNLLVSDISYWEVAVKAAKGRLTFSVDAAVWLQRAEQAPGIAPLPLDRPTLLLSTRLGGSVHNDPADRMLLAAARLNSVPLVTADRLIVEYVAANPGTSVVDARPGAS
jgi:PIN domain nuclease of toxin-antitoxin system